MPILSEEELDELDALVEHAEAMAESDWERGFVAEMREKLDAYGRHARLTDRQREKLEEIADGNRRLRY